MDYIKDREEQICCCFNSGKGVDKVWYEESKMYVLIVKDENWDLNKDVLQGWFFDFTAFEELGLEIDSTETPGVYVIRIASNWS